MVGFIVKSPLTSNNVSTRSFNLFNHFDEFFLLVFLQYLELLHRRNVQFMLCLWLWWLEWTGQNGNLAVINLLWHLWVRKVFDAPADFTLHLDQLEVHIFSLEISHRQDCVNSHVSKMIVSFRDNFRPQRGFCCLQQV